MSFAEVLQAQSGHPQMKGSFSSQLKTIKRVSGDPWIEVLRSVEGRVGHDGVARVSVLSLMEVLGIPPEKRDGTAYRRLKACMCLLGWSPLRQRGIDVRGAAAVVRGYARLS